MLKQLEDKRSEKETFVFVFLTATMDSRLPIPESAVVEKICFSLDIHEERKEKRGPTLRL